MHASPKFTGAAFGLTRATCWLFIAATRFGSTLRHRRVKTRLTPLVGRVLTRLGEDPPYGLRTHPLSVKELPVDTALTAPGRRHRLRPGEAYAAALSSGTSRLSSP